MNIRLTLAKIQGVSLKEKITFTRNLALIVKAGLSLPQGLEVLAKETSSPLLKLILADVKGEVARGNAFSESLARYPRAFNPFYTNMVKTGEASGTLDSILYSLAIHMEKEKALRSKVTSALIYPAVILVVMSIVLTAMMVFVVPRLTAVFQSFNAQLPITTRAMIALSNFIVAHFILLLVLIVGMLVGIWFFFGRMRPGKIALSWITLHIPVFRILTKKINTARTARALQTLIKSGLPILEALSITSEVLQNHFYKEMLLDAKKGVEKGKALHDVLASYGHLYPPLAAQLVAIGEQTGSLDLVLTDLADFYEEEVDNVTKNLSSIIEPLLMLIIGAAVGFLAISMLQPIYTLTNSVGTQ